MLSTRVEFRVLPVVGILLLLIPVYLLARWTRISSAADSHEAGVAEFGSTLPRMLQDPLVLDVPPVSYETATNDAQGGFGTVRASLDYRTFVAGRVYVSGEFEAALRGGAGPAGYLREGTGVGDRDVWPGSLERREEPRLRARTPGSGTPDGLLGGRWIGISLPACIGVTGHPIIPRCVVTENSPPRVLRGGVGC